MGVLIPQPVWLPQSTGAENTGNYDDDDIIIVIIIWAASTYCFFYVLGIILSALCVLAYLIFTSPMGQALSSFYRQETEM